MKILKKLQRNMPAWFSKKSKPKIPALPPPDQLDNQRAQPNRDPSWQQRSKDWLQKQRYRAKDWWTETPEKWLQAHKDAPEAVKQWVQEQWQQGKQSTQRNLQQGWQKIQQAIDNSQAPKVVQEWWSEQKEMSRPAEDQEPLDLALSSLQNLIEDPRIPETVRQGLLEDYAEVEDMLDRLQNGHIHIAVFGRVSVGKSALLNALFGEKKFSTSPLHGETIRANKEKWAQYQSGGVFLIDTPGINEIDGEDREYLAKSVVNRSDLVLFVVDSDLTETEKQALQDIASQHRPIVLVLNKSDRYRPAEQDALLQSLARHTQGIVDARNIVLAAADPAPRLVIRVDERGMEHEEWLEPKPDVTWVKERLWTILEKEGKTLAALNASLFASQLSDEIGARILHIRRQLGQKIIRTYCTAKGVTVALNPIPVADLLAAAAVDISMVIHLSNIYGLPLSKNEAGRLLKTIGTQMMVLMGSTWAINLASSALKLGSGGLSTLVTGGAQAGVAYYSTWIVGQVAERYLAQGKSWGEGGPKLVVREILNQIDKDSILQQAKEDIRLRLQKGTA